MGNCCTDQMIEKDLKQQSIAAESQKLSSGSVLLQKMLLELNTLRKNPGVYAQKVNELYTSKIKGSTHVLFLTDYQEAGEAFKEAEVQLMRTPQLPQVKLDRGLIASSYTQAAFLCHVGRSNAAGKGGSSVKDRLSEFGNLETDKCAECSIAIASTDPSRVLIELLADNGIITRSNRLALLNPSFKQFGCAVVRDPSSQLFFVVMHLAERYSTDPARAVPSIISQAEMAASQAQQ